MTNKNLNEEISSKKYYQSVEKARQELQSRVQNLLNEIEAMQSMRTDTLIRCNILNKLLRPNISSTKEDKLADVYESSNLASSAHKTICYLNFLGNSSDTSWLSLCANNLDRIFSVNSAQFRAITDWVQACEKALKTVFEQSDSNFYTNVFSNWADWFIQGVSCLKVDIKLNGLKDYGRNTIYFSNINIKSTTIETNDTGDITKVAYNFSLSLEEAIRKNKFELKDLCTSDGEYERLRKVLTEDGSDSEQYKRQRYDFVDLTIIRPKFANWATNFFLNKPYIRMIICKTTRKVIYVSEEDTFPFIVSRLFPSVENPYGVSSLWSAVKGLLFEANLHEAKEKSISYHINPVMMVSPGYSADILSKHGRALPPGDLIETLDSNGRPMMVPMQFGGDLRLIDLAYQQTYAELQEALMANEIFPRNASGVSATESLRIAMQWNRRILPLIESRKQDFLSPLCLRVLYLLKDMNMLPQFPVELPIEIDPIKFIGLEFGGQLRNMSQTQSILDIDNWISMMAKLGYTSALNIDVIARTLTNKFNMPVDFLKSVEQLQAEQNARALQAEEEQSEEYVSNILKNKKV